MTHDRLNSEEEKIKILEERKKKAAPDRKKRPLVRGRTDTSRPWGGVTGGKFRGGR